MTAKKPETLWNQVRKYMNSHPGIAPRTLKAKFKDNAVNVMTRYYYDWKNYILPTLEFYKVVMKKFAPIKPLSVKDREKIKRMERILEGSE